MINTDFHIEREEIKITATSWINRKYGIDNYITFKIKTKSGQITLFLTPEQFEQIKDTEISDIEDGNKKD